MRSHLALLASVVALSFSAVACGQEDDDARDVPTTQQSQLIAAGGECSSNDECQSGLTCEISAASRLGIRGEPVMVDPCEANPNAEGCAKPKGKPAPSGNTSSSGGQPPPSAPTGVPNVPADDLDEPPPPAKRVCTAR